MDETRTARSAESPAEGGVGLGGAMAGIGMLILALFPFSIPFLVLTLVFTAPLLILGAAAALPIVIVAGLVFGLRAIRARIGSRPAAPPGHPISAAE